MEDKTPAQKKASAQKSNEKGLPRWTQMLLPLPDGSVRVIAKKEPPNKE